MKKGNKVVLIGGISLLVISILTMFIIYKVLPSNGTIATISVYGEVKEKIDLSKVKTPRIITIDNGQGGISKVQVAPGKIAILDSNCADHICVAKGFISDSLMPIVCLPNGVLIEITQSTPIDSEIDTIAE